MAAVFSVDDQRWRDAMGGPVHVLYGVSPGEQESSFQNATLQSDEDFVISFSVATHITLPPGVATNQRRAAQFIGRICDRMAKAAARNGCTVTFEVQVGREDDDED